jgi:hypothetical protein
MRPVWRVLDFGQTSQAPACLSNKDKRWGTQELDLGGIAAQLVVTTASHHVVCHRTLRPGWYGFPTNALVYNGRELLPSACFARRVGQLRQDTCVAEAVVDLRRLSRHVICPCESAAAAASLAAIPHVRNTLHRVARVLGYKWSVVQYTTRLLTY